MMTVQKPAVKPSEATEFVDSVNLYVEISLTRIKQDLIVIKNIENRLQSKDPTKAINELDRTVLKSLICSSEIAEEKGRELLRKSAANHTLNLVVAELVNHDKMVITLIKNAKECLDRVSSILDKPINNFISIEDYAAQQNSIPSTESVDPLVSLETAFYTPRHFKVVDLLRQDLPDSPKIHPEDATMKLVK